MVDRQGLVNEYNDRAIDVIVNGLGLNFNHKTLKALCPFHSEKTPSFMWNKKTNSFHCFGCGENLDIISYLINFENMSFIQATNKILDELGQQPEVRKVNQQKKRIEKKQFTLPKIKTKELSDVIVDHLNKRGLKKSTLDFWRVQQANINFAPKGQPDDIKKAMVFKYYDEENKLVHETYRSSDKKFKQNFGSKAILWGMWHIDISKPLIIVEGQLDAMSVWQSGYENVVSVPSGSNNNLYLEYNYDFLSQFKDIIFWGDNDEAGRKAADNIKIKFDNVELKFHKEYIDPNEVLMKLGPEEIKRFLNEEPELPIGIKSLDQLSYNTDIIPECNRIETGFKELDEHIDDLRMEQLTIIVGRDNEGKSTFISQIIVHQLIKNNKTFLYSNELGDQGLQDWLFRQLIGEEKHCYNVKKSKYGEKYFIKPSILQAIRKWGANKLYVVDRKNDDITTDQNKLFKTMVMLAVKFNVKLFVIDNLQSTLEENASSLYSDQSNFVEKFRKFCLKYSVHGILVTHPRKTDELKADENTLIGNLKKDDISGSKNISNKAHNILSIERNFNKGDFDMVLTNLKDKHKGIRKGFKYMFDENTFRFYNEVTTNKIEPFWKDELADGIDKNTYELTEVKESYLKNIADTKDESPF